MEQWPNNRCVGSWVLGVFAGQCLSAIIQVQAYSVTLMFVQLGALLGK